MWAWFKAKKMLGQWCIKEETELRSLISNVVDVRDPIQIAYDQLAERISPPMGSVQNLRRSRRQLPELKEAQF
jgi:hypothetical protein